MASAQILTKKYAQSPRGDMCHVSIKTSHLLTYLLTKRYRAVIFYRENIDLLLLSD